MRRVKRKRIQYGHPWLAGVYYQSNGAYYENDDGHEGKVIVIVPARCDERQRHGGCR